MNLETLLQSLQKHIAANPKLTKTELAEKIGVGRSELAQWLDKDYQKKPTADKAFKIYNYLKGTNFMTPQTKTEEQFRIEDLNRKLAKLTCKFENVQSVSESNGGWAPKEGQSEPELADAISQMIKDGLYDQVRALLDQIQSGKTESIVKARTNVNGVTRGPLVIKSSHRGARATVVDTQSFEEGRPGVVKFSKSTIEDCEENLKDARRKEVELSHQNPLEQPMHFDGNILNTDERDMAKAERLHMESIAADPEAYRANLAMIKEREARLERLKNGRGNLDDLRSKMAAMNS